ncbi:MAG: hypothetical protein OEZ02_10600 [Anaerolineae bacterium]|nr:hypothetical protein [Anaerolineae bacterium]
MTSHSKPSLLFLFALFLSMAACTQASPTTPPSSSPPTEPPTLTITPRPSASPTVAPTPTITASPMASPFPEPAGCLPPPDDYSRITVNGQTFNRRTLAMLQHAASIYSGPIDIANTALTQGSYTSGEELSFGTHSGGGAVDLSVLARDRYEILWDEIPDVLLALRLAGFAAWLRQYGELSTGSPIHIHAVAIGDAELSAAARDQIIGPYGYFRGYNGLPPEFGGPSLDIYGEPILCNWMRQLGYQDLRNP